jgi:hypothetical protein
MKKSGNMRGIPGKFCGFSGEKFPDFLRFPNLFFAIPHDVLRTGKQRKKSTALNRHCIKRIFLKNHVIATVCGFGDVGNSGIIPNGKTRKFRDIRLS